MAGTSNNQFNPAFLTQNQQTLLMAALASQQAEQQKSGQLLNGQDLTNTTGLDYSMDTLDPSLFLSAQADQPLGTFDMNVLDYLDSNQESVDYDLADADGYLDDSGDPNSFDGEGEGDLHDKRKSTEDDKDDDENEPKRREGEERTAKKPGRKPLTSEPTTKRKAQNRAAQRAFRERKEKHLKDLETKVAELEKNTESTTQENGVLKAQVERLQLELKEYRKRLSQTSTLNRSPPASSLQSYLPSGTNTLANSFQFNFPRFGSLPTGPLFNDGTPIATSNSPTRNSVPGVLSRHDSTDGQPSPTSNVRASISSAGSPSKQSSVSNGGMSKSNSGSPAFTENYGSLFPAPSITGLGRTPKDSYNMFTNNTTAEPQNMAQIQSNSESHTPQSRIFQFNSTSNSSASPSASSVSQYGNGGSSSCGTSPEPSHNSPATGNKDATLGTINEQGQGYDNKQEAPKADNAAVTTFGLESQSDSVNGMDYFVNQNGGQFDPILFGDYRDSTAAIVGDGDFTGGFFNDAMPNFDFSAPLDWNDLTGGSLRTGLTPAVQKPNPMEQADALLSGIDEEEVVPAEDISQMLSCDKIWAKVQERQDFKDGALDIDGLCDELRAKAKCSESGVVIDQKDVDAALQRLPTARPSPN